MSEPTTAECYAFVLGALEDLAAGRPRSFADAATALARVELLKKRHQRFLDGCARATELANRWGLEDLAPVARGHGCDLRRALGDAYLGGPLL